MHDQIHKPQGSHHGRKDLRVGVYVCRCGGNISDVIDVERVADAAGQIPGVATSCVHTFMCSDPGQQEIQKDIAEQGLNRVVVASCSPFLHELTFRGAVERAGLNPYLYEHVNIREQGSWAHSHDPQGATQKAIQLIAGAIGKLHHAEPLENIRLPNHQAALVIGGGVAGMRAACDLAQRGIPVILVEKSDRLGGHLNDLGPLFPTDTHAAVLVRDLERQVEQSPGIEVLRNADVKTISGFIGNFETCIAGTFGPGGSVSVVSTHVGAVIIATGFTPYELKEGEYAYGQSPAVLTMPEFIRTIRDLPDQATTLVVGGRRVRRIAFVHCVGSRQVDGVHVPQPDGNVNNYCSRVCCTTTLQQALNVKRRFPDIDVFDLHQDIRTYGRGHEDYYNEAGKAGVVFFRWHGEEPPTVSVNASGRGDAAPLNITVKDRLTWGEEVTLGVDLVVLATGMMPGQIDHLREMLKLPIGEDRFLQEVHPKLRPVEVSLNGILLAGTAQGPMNIAEALAAGSAAAVKASAMLAREQVQLSPFVAFVDDALCSGSGQCLAQCEYSGALQLVERVVDGERVTQAQVNAGLCKGCGACVAVCPSRAIQLKGATLVQYEAMVDGLVADVPLAAVSPRG